MSDATPARREGSRTLPFVLMLGLLSLALWKNVQVTGDLTWPAFDIQYREMAMAQTLLDQGYGPDCTYRGESLWYNPLSSWLAALGSVAFGQALREVVPRLGPFVNLLAPLALFLLVAALADGWTALAAVAALVFITGNAFPFWQAASYSPWFAPENYGQAFLYLSLLLAVAALRSPRPLRWHVALGVTLGVTFLVHTAPALIAGAAFVLLAVHHARQGEGWRRPAGLLAVTVAIAFLVSLPLVWHVVGRYHLGIKNPFPSEAPESILDLGERLGLFKKLVTRSPFVVAVVALPLFAWPRRRSPEGAVLLAWMAAVLLFLAYGDVRSLAHRAGLDLPGIVPSFHFLFHAMALVSVGVGIALVAAARAAARAIARSVAGTMRWAASGELLAAALIVVCVVAAWGPHSRRYDVVHMREEALSFREDIPGEAFDWIRSRTDSDDVFLSTDEVSLYLVAPAGRKVVSTNRFFSSPYVDWRQRERVRSQLYDLLRAGDLEAFDRLAARYSVRYLVASDGLSDALRQKAGLAPELPPPVTRADMAGRPGFESLFMGRGVTIYQRVALRESQRADARLPALHGEGGGESGGRGESVQAPATGDGGVPGRPK